MKQKIENKKAIYISAIAFSLMGILTFAGTEFDQSGSTYYILFTLAVLMLIIGIVATLGFLNSKQIKYIFYPSIVVGIVATAYVLYIYLT